MYLVKLANNGIEFYLRNTVWTSDKARATHFESEIDAAAALERAKKFMRKSDAKRAQFVTE